MAYVHVNKILVALFSEKKFPCMVILHFAVIQRWQFPSHFHNNCNRSHLIAWAGIGPRWCSNISPQSRTRCTSQSTKVPQSHLQRLRISSTRCKAAPESTQKDHSKIELLTTLRACVKPLGVFLDPAVRLIAAHHACRESKLRESRP